MQMIRRVSFVAFLEKNTNLGLLPISWQKIRAVDVCVVRHSVSLDHYVLGDQENN